eukprot:TRINITY_DN4550_c0_g1_i1.p1 TRINITY_DN4550_c0_g1~~TRINITY_DN4550_c0_g1_i1.p1  ORF type:complete len:189 (-),score=34.80 TRINITY_DN4550_c0_g1_i1:108-674(-)
MVDNNGRTVLHLGTMGTLLPVESLTQLLKDTSPSFREIQDNQGNTALHCASRPEYAKILLKDSRNGYRRMVNMHSETALHRAAYTKKKSVVKELLKESTTEYLAMTDLNDNTAAQVANERNQVEIMKYILDVKYMAKILSLISENLFATDGDNGFWSNDALVRETLVWMIGDECIELKRAGDRTVYYL